MRPGQSCPGVGGGFFPETHGVGSGFNEAGAIMPRSGGDERLGRSRPEPGFNEAGAIMPRSGAGSAHSTR